MKLFDLFKPQLETITVYVLLTTNRNIKLNQLNQIYFIESKEKLNTTTVIPIVSKIQLLDITCTHLKMLEHRNFIKTGLQDLHRLTQLRHITPLSMALRNIFINREIHYVISIAYSSTPLLNVILLHYYPELSLVTWEICTNARLLPANSISILAQAHNGQEFIWDHQRPNHNPSIVDSHFVTAEPVRSSIKRSTWVVEYNGDSESDNNNEDVEFIDINLPYNKLSLQLLANNSITRTKKKRVIIDDEGDESLKSKTKREKRKPVKQVEKKSTKASAPISDLVDQPPPDIQALLMNTNIVIPAVHLFQISPKFWKETRRLMTVLCKPRKKKIVLSNIPIEKEEEINYADIHQTGKDVDTNHALFQTPKQELAKILQSKKKAFCIKATIWKSDKETKYALPDSHVKVDQGSYLVIINSRLVKRLGLKVRPTSTLAPYRLSISVANGDFTELKS